MVLGGVVAAGIGAGACWWLIPALPPGLRPAIAPVAPDEQTLAAAREAGAAAARAEIEARAAELTTRAAEAGADAARQALADAVPAPQAQPEPQPEPQPAPQAPPAAAALPDEVGQRMAALEKGLADLSARLDALEARPAPEAAPKTAPPPPPITPETQAALDALSAEVASLRARIDDLAARPAADPAIARQVEELARQVQALQQGTDQAASRARVATAAAALAVAIDSGAPRDPALAELRAAGIEPPAVLTGDVPRLEQLRAEFPSAARAALRAALESRNDVRGPMQRIGDFLRVQTGARSIEPREGNDPDAILSRAGAAVEAGDLSSALAQIETLPEPARQAMADWSARARLRLDAQAALAGLLAGGR